jgi:sec-independent protein translocase protein TatA
MIGMPELLVVGVVVLVLFGANAIPKFAKSLGEAKKEFEKGMKEGAKEEPKKDELKKEDPKLEEPKKEEKQ